MAYSFTAFEQRIQDIQEHLAREFSSIRTGRATPSILDSVLVESYGTRMHIGQIASIAIEDARTLRIAPWDQSQSKEIEKAIVAANLGLSVSTDDKGLRIFFPELTAERRQALIKLAKAKLEDARTALRGARDDVWNDIQAQERNKQISEDDKFRNKEDMQKRVDAANQVFDEAFARKEKEIVG